VTLDKPDDFDVLTFSEALDWLRLADDYPTRDEAAKALKRATARHGLRPIRGCGRSMKFLKGELRRWAWAQTVGAGEGTDAK